MDDILIPISRKVSFLASREHVAREKHIGTLGVLFERIVILRWRSLVLGYRVQHGLTLGTIDSNVFRPREGTLIDRLVQNGKDGRADGRKEGRKEDSNYNKFIA